MSLLQDERISSPVRVANVPRFGKQAEANVPRFGKRAWQFKAEKQNKRFRTAAELGLSLN